MDASKKKECIALLSMYGDEDDNYNMEEDIYTDHKNNIDNDAVHKEQNKTVNTEEDNDVQKEMDPLDKFLPPPPTTKCSDKLQERIEMFRRVESNTGRSYNSEVRKRKEYRNPDFLLHALTHQNIDQIGSCFRKEVFDPYGYDISDYYDEIEADMKPELERKDHKSILSIENAMRKKTRQSKVDKGSPMHTIEIGLSGFTPIPKTVGFLSTVGVKGRIARRGGASSRLASHYSIGKTVNH